MASALSKFTWADHKEALRAYVGLGVSTAEDTNLELWLAAAATDLDELAGWIYTDADDEEIDVSPADPSANASWKLGIYEWVKAFRASYGSPASEGAKVVKTGQLQESYTGDAKIAAVMGRAAALIFWFTAIVNISRSPKAG